MDTAEIDSTTLYFQECSRHRLLDQPEETTLITKAQNGDVNSRDQLILYNQRLVIRIAMRYIVMAGDQELLELVQYGNMGLMVAIQKFETARKNRLSTFAVPWIRAYVRRFAMASAYRISSSYQDRERAFRINGAISRLRQELGREPSIGEIADALKLKYNQVMEVMPLLSTTTSLDFKPDDGRGDPLGEILPDPSPAPEAEVSDRFDRGLVERILADALDDRQRFVLERRYGLGGCPVLLLEEIGIQLGVSRERVRQIEDQAIVRLRRHMQKTGQYFRFSF